MSRRRKRRAQGELPANRRTSRLRNGLVGAVLLVAVALFVAYLKVGDYLNSDAFREKLEEKASRELGIPVTLADFQWRGGRARTSAVTAQSDGALQKLAVEGLELKVTTDWVAREQWDVLAVQVEKASVSLDLRKPFAQVTFPEEPPQWFDKYLPESVAVHDVSVLRADAEIFTESGQFSLSGAQCEMLTEGDAMLVKASRGVVGLPFSIVPQAEMKHVDMRVLKDRVLLDQAHFSLFEHALLELEGEVELPSGKALLYGTLSELPLHDIVPSDWKQKLSGVLAAKGKCQRTAQGALAVRAQVEVADAELTALPMLDSLVAYTRIADFKRLHFSKSFCNVQYENEVCKISGIDLRSDGLLRVEGQVTLRGDALDGVLLLGFYPGVLSAIPGAEEKVFVRGKDGLNWTTVKLSGTLDAIEEDLTGRLKSAALGQILETVGGQSVQKAADTVNDLLETGLKAVTPGADNPVQKPIDAGLDVLDAGLGTLFGRRQKPPEDEEKK